VNDLWRVTYMGEGVKPTPFGAFSRYVTAYVDEAFAKSLAGDEDWIVADPAGATTGAPKAEKPAEEKKPEPKKAEKKADEKKAEKQDEKKADEKKPEKAEKA
jgi:hypothetical protein